MNYSHRQQRDDLTEELIDLYMTVKIRPNEDVRKFFANIKQIENFSEQ